MGNCCTTREENLRLSEKSRNTTSSEAYYQRYSQQMKNLKKQKKVTEESNDTSTCSATQIGSHYMSKGIPEAPRDSELSSTNSNLLNLGSDNYESEYLCSDMERMMNDNESLRATEMTVYKKPFSEAGDMEDVCRNLETEYFSPRESLSEVRNSKLNKI